MSARRYHPGLLEDAARELDQKLRALSTGETHRPGSLQDHGRHRQHLRTLIDGDVEVHGLLAPVKRLVRRAMRPYLFRQKHINRLLIERLDDVRDELDQIQATLARVRDEVREDLDHHELRSRRESLRAAEPAPATVPIGSRNPAIPEGARLLLGSTPVPKPGFVHIDPECDSAQLAVALDGIPAKPGTAAEIVATNVLERYTAGEVRESLLPHWASLLQAGGTLTVIADDFEAAADRLRDGLLDAPGLALAVFADGRPRRSAHTPESLRRDLDDAGFVDVTVVDRVQRPETNAYGFAIKATVPAA